MSLRARGQEPPDEEITEQVISQGKGLEAVFLVNGLA